MDWIKKIASTALLLSILLVVNSCSIKIGLAPISSIDYSKVKTISIADFKIVQSMYMPRWLLNLTRV